MLHRINFRSLNQLVSLGALKIARFPYNGRVFHVRLKIERATLLEKIGRGVLAGGVDVFDGLDSGEREFIWRNTHHRPCSKRKKKNSQIHTGSLRMI